MKVSLFDKEIRNQFYKIFGIILSIISFVFYFFEIERNSKLITFILFCVGFTLIYMLLWLRAKNKKGITLKINLSTVEVKFGDIFSEKDAFKVIGFNEYFDTQVDNVLISESSLNGQYIKKFYQNNVKELDSAITKNEYLAHRIVGKDSNRKVGKTIRYKLGSIWVAPNDYLLTALTHFDKDNKAYLSINNYIDFLFNFWEEIDRVYAGRTVVLPVLGSGITRFTNYRNITEQELLD